MFKKSILAGIFLSLAAYASTKCSGVLSGVIFSVGLFLIVMTGSKLFTGQMLNCFQQNKLLLMKTWILVFIGNFIGCFIVAALLGFPDITITHKLLPFWNIFVKGVLCNMLVCIAVALSNRCETVIGIFICITLPITIFILAGYEHCVANMFYFSCNIFRYENIYEYLIPATLGNILGGCFITYMIRNKHV